MGLLSFNTPWEWLDLNGRRTGAGGLATIEEDGEGDDIDDEFEKALGEMEPDNVDCSVDNGGCLCTPLLPFGSLTPLAPKYLVMVLSFSAFVLVPLSRKICKSSVCCIKANCSAAFNTLDVMKTSISFCNGMMLLFVKYKIFKPKFLVLKVTKTF